MYYYTTVDVYDMSYQHATHYYIYVLCHMLHYVMCTHDIHDNVYSVYKIYTIYTIYTIIVVGVMCHTIYLVVSCVMSYVALCHVMLCWVMRYANMLIILYASILSNNIY